MVCSTDILLAGSLPQPPSCAAGDILLYAVGAPLEYATGHGVAVTRHQDPTLEYATGHGVAVTRHQDTTLENILYQPTIQELR
jgi:hypothetical protein